jgi:hypothetical protein
MEAVWNTTAIDAMSPEQRLRNVCRQIEQEVCQWGRVLGYRGKPTGRGKQYTGSDRVELACGGNSARSWVRVYIDKQPATARIYCRPGCAETIYLELAAAVDLAHDFECSTTAH